MPGVEGRLATIEAIVMRVEAAQTDFIEEVRPLVHSHGTKLAEWEGHHVNSRLRALRTDVDNLKIERAERRGASKMWLAAWGVGVAVGTAVIPRILEAM